jgi:hypothetical protein
LNKFNKTLYTKKSIIVHFVRIHTYASMIYSGASRVQQHIYHGNVDKTCKKIVRKRSEI